MTSQAESIFPIIPQPIVLAVDTLSRPFRRTPTPSGPMSCDKTSPDPRLSLFHEDVFSRLLSGPLVIFHFAFYCAVPVYYLVHFSPFAAFEGSQLNQAILLFLTQYLTAILVVSWFGRYTGRKVVTACVFMVTTMALVAGMKMFMDDLVASKG